MMTLGDNVLAFGSGIAGIGILGAGLLALLFRHPNPPRWTRPEVVALLLCVPLTATIGFGLGYVLYGLNQLASGAGDPGELPVLAAVLIAIPLLWRALKIRQRLKAYTLVTGDGAPEAALTLEFSPATVGEAPAPVTTRGQAAGLPRTTA